MMTPLSRPWMVILLWALTAFAQAQEAAPSTPSSTDSFSRRFKNLGFHAGTLTEFYDAVQIDDNGKKEKFAFNPMLGFSTDVEIVPDIHFIPEIHWVLPREAEEGITQNLFMFRADVAWRPSDWWRWRLGSSLMVNNIRGEGGSRQVRNGNGYSKFYVPADSSTSINNTLDLAVEGLWDAFGLRLQTYVYSVLKSERRQISYTLMFTYYYELGK